MPLDNPFFDEALAAMVAKELAKPQAATSEPAPKKKSIGPWPYISLLGGAVADVTTTNHALKRDGVRETNSLFGSQPSLGRLIAGKSLGMGSTALIMHLLDKLGKDKAAKALGYGMGGLQGGVSIWNMNQGKKKK